MYFRTHLESAITDQDSRSVFSVDISKGGRTRTLTLSDAYLCWHGDGCRWMRVLYTWKPKYFRQSSPHDSRCQWVKLGATLRVDFCRCRQERGVGWESEGVLRFFFSAFFGWVGKMESLMYSGDWYGIVFGVGKETRYPERRDERAKFGDPLVTCCCCCCLLGGASWGCTAYLRCTVGWRHVWRVH